MLIYEIILMIQSWLSSVLLISDIKVYSDNFISNKILLLSDVSYY